MIIYRKECKCLYIIYLEHLFILYTYFTSRFGKRKGIK